MRVLRVLAVAVTTVVAMTIGATPSWATGRTPANVAPFSCTPHVYTPVWSGSQIFGNTNFVCTRYVTSITTQVILWRNNGNNTYTRVGDTGAATKSGSTVTNFELGVYDLAGCSSSSHVYHTEGIFSYKSSYGNKSGITVNSGDVTLAC